MFYYENNVFDILDLHHNFIYLVFRTMRLLLLLFFLSLALSKDVNELKTVKYILYDVNPGEGFNLRRDVYMRMAVLVKKLNIAYNDTQWVLVLPPWGHLYHWQSRQLGHQARIPWSQFFRVSSLNMFVPVMEFYDWIKETSRVVDSVYYLQGYKEGWKESLRKLKKVRERGGNVTGRDKAIGLSDDDKIRLQFYLDVMFLLKEMGSGYKEGWKDGKFEEKFDIRECIDEPRYNLNDEGVYEGQFFHYEGVVAKRFACLSVHGRTSVILPMIGDLQEQSVMLDRAENLLHDRFGDVEYWGARRSMRFSEELVERANVFRMKVLGSDDVKDNTVVVDDWREHKEERLKRGGEYGCVHLRRGDYARSRRDQVPSIAWAAEQLSRRMKERSLEVLFVSSDASQEEFRQLSNNIKDVKVVRFEPSREELELYKDGGVAIIDQSICSHARYFIGSKESTFTFRIQEEREIMGFILKDTFDMLCGEGKDDCEKGTQWKIEWGKKDQKWM